MVLKLDTVWKRKKNVLNLPFESEKFHSVPLTLHWSAYVKKYRLFVKQLMVE